MGTGIKWEQDEGIWWRRTVNRCALCLLKTGQGSQVVTEGTFQISGLSRIQTRPGSPNCGWTGRCRHSIRLTHALPAMGCNQRVTRATKCHGAAAVAAWPGSGQQYSISGNLGKKPESKIGYTLGARTAARFSPAVESISPGPAVYQKRLGRGHGFKPSSAPFGSTSQRNKESSSKLQVPGLLATRSSGNTEIEWHISACTTLDDVKDWMLIQLA
ncbi:protein pitchfork-like isoform X2 [Hypanus sabinus]|uniref:protein pitchfork-like isoform X2 n=1 Tax=Hypanus sabinus TaxID=79690 RepID=UPI0028C4AC68|nr:protein pitchfork-like isoform X2 [Hypanus sabinus]